MLSLTSLVTALLLISILLTMATLGTSVIYAATQILSRCTELLFDLPASRRRI